MIRSTHSFALARPIRWTRLCDEPPSQTREMAEKGVRK